MFNIPSFKLLVISPHLLIYLCFVIILFASILLYFRLADHYKIVDKPNERSSHSEVTIRGGGVIYLIAALIVMLLYPVYLLPSIAIFVIGSISFLDDRVTLSSRIRILFHIVAVTIIFYFLGVFDYLVWWSIPLLYVVVIGVINAYNFMDGINGITGAYSLIVLMGLQYINYQLIHFIQDDVIWLPILASVVFLFFNFRKKARCFAGDVGSISISLWIIFLLLALMSETGDCKYILFLSVYGVDSVLTIIHRIILKENIFNPHRLHFYQILANQQRIPHLTVSSIYVFIQAVIISVVVLSSWKFIYLFIVTTVPLIIAYCVFKPKLMLNRPLEKS